MAKGQDTRNHPNRGVHRDRFTEHDPRDLSFSGPEESYERPGHRQTTLPLPGERSILTGRLLNPPGAVPTGELDMLTGQPIKAVPRR